MQVKYNAERENRTGRRYFGEYYLDPGVNSVTEEFVEYLKEKAKSDSLVEHLLEDRVIVILKDETKEEVDEEVKKQVAPKRKSKEIPEISE